MDFTQLKFELGVVLSESEMRAKFNAILGGELIEKYPVPVYFR